MSTVRVLPRRGEMPIPLELRAIADAIERGDIQAECCVVIRGFEDGQNWEAHRLGWTPPLSFMGAVTLLAMRWANSAQGEEG